jgi:hypothetical protein
MSREFPALTVSEFPVAVIISGIPDVGFSVSVDSREFHGNNACRGGGIDIEGLQVTHTSCFRDGEHNGCVHSRR